MSTSPSGRPPAPVPEGAPEYVTGYRDLCLTGSGTSSVVYRAVQDAYDRVVALKVLTAGADETAQQRFLQEVRLTARLTGHPHVVTVLDTGMTWSGRPYLATEFFQEGTLADRLRRDGALSPAETARIGAKIAEALAAAHAAGITHRDVKPSNILISVFDEPALADFGVSALRSAGASGHPHGFTPLHAAPEVLAGAEPDAAADVYALGSTLYEMLAGHPAFDAPDGDLAVLTAMVTSREPPPLPGEPESAVAGPIRRAMAKRPEQRWPSAADFAEALRVVAVDPQGSSAPSEEAGRIGAPGRGPLDGATDLTDTVVSSLVAGGTTAEPAEPADAPGSAAPAPTGPALVTGPQDHASRPLWERPTAASPLFGYPAGERRLSMTMLRADRALAESEAPDERPARGRWRLALTITGATVLGAAVALTLTGLRGRPAPVVAGPTIPPTSSAPPASSVEPSVLDASRPTNVIVTPEADKTKVRLDWHIAPGNDHALAVQIQAALGGSPPQTVMMPARTFSYEVSGLDPSVPGYCFTVGAVVAWGSPSQVSWSQPRCTPGAKVVTPTPDPSGS